MWHVVEENDDAVTMLLLLPKDFYSRFFHILPCQTFLFKCRVQMLRCLMLLILEKRQKYLENHRCFCQVKLKMYKFYRNEILINLFRRKATVDDEMKKKHQQYQVSIIFFRLENELSLNGGGKHQETEMEKF